MTDTRQALAALLPCPFCGNSKGLAVANENPQDLSGGYFIACPSCDASTGLRFACGEDPIPLLIEQWNRRAALSAQSVAGAVATDETGWLIEHSGEILPGAEQRAQVSWLRVQMKFNGYGAREFGFTHDANEAASSYRARARQHTLKHKTQKKKKRGEKWTPRRRAS